MTIKQEIQKSKKLSNNKHYIFTDSTTSYLKSILELENKNNDLTRPITEKEIVERCISYYYNNHYNDEIIAKRLEQDREYYYSMMKALIQENNKSILHSYNELKDLMSRILDKLDELQK